MLEIEVTREALRKSGERVGTTLIGATHGLARTQRTPLGLAQLQVRRRKRKKVAVGERQPLLRPETANQVWSMDFMFDRTAVWRTVKCLTIVDDATHVPERAIGGLALTRNPDQLSV